MPSSTATGSRKRVQPQNVVKVVKYTSANEIRTALNFQDQGALLEALINLRNQFTIRFREPPIAPQDERLHLCQAWLEAAPGAQDLFDIWEKTEQRHTALLSAIVSFFASLLALLSTHLPYHGYGHGILKTLLSATPMRRLNTYIGSSHAELTLVTLKLLNAMSAFAGGKEKRTVMESFAWENKVLPKLLHMRRKAKAEQTVDPFERPDIRALYIFFLLSFVDSDASSHLKTTFLDYHRDAFASIFKGLVDDHYDIVRRTLEVCWNDIWSDVKIKKTLKINLFGEQTIAQLCKLYDRANPEEDNEDRIPADLAHHFLLAICTRPGMGLCFKERGWYSREVGEEELVKEHGASQPKHGRIHNKILSNILRTLKVNEDPRQQELALKIMAACPELVATYWAAANLTLEPRLSSRWIANIGFLGSIISLPVPSASFFIPDSNLHQPTPPPLSNIIENVLPSVNTKGHFSKGLLSRSALVQHCTALALAKCLLKFEAVSREMIKIEALLEENQSDGQWYRRRRDLEREVRRRVPDFQVIIVFSQQKHEQSQKPNPTRLALLTESSRRLLWLYYRCLPGLASEARFDVGKSLVHIAEDYSTQTEISNDSGRAVARLKTIQQLHSLRLLKEGNQFNWAAKAAGSSDSNFHILLKTFTNSTVHAIKIAVTDLLRHVLADTILFQEDPDEINLWLKSLSFLRRSDSAESPDGALLSDEGDSVLPFLDECIQRCLKTPYKYIEDLYALQSASPGSQGVVSQHLAFYPSPVLMTVLEQLDTKVAGKLLSASDVLALVSFVRRVIQHLIGKQKELGLLRVVGERIDNTLRTEQLFDRYPVMTTAIRREVAILRSSLQPRSFCIESMEVLVTPAEDVEQFLHDIEAASTSQESSPRITSACELVDWLRIVDRPISERQLLRLAAAVELLHPPTLRQLSENLDPRHPKQIWYIFNASFPRRLEYLDFDVLITHWKAEDLSNEDHRATFLQALFNRTSQFIDFKRAVHHLEHALLDAVGIAEMRKSLLSLLSTIIRLTEKNLTSAELLALKRVVFTSDGVVKSLYLDQDISPAEAEELKLLARAVLDPGDSNDKDIAQDVSQQWLNHVKALLSSDQLLGPLVISPWIQYLPEDDLFALLDLLVPKISGIPSQPIVAFTESILRALRIASSFKPAIEGRLSERLPQFMTLRPVLPQSAVLEDVTALAINATLPLGMTGELQTSGKLSTLVSRAELRWSRRLTPSTAFPGFEQLLRQPAWSESSADIISGLLYRHSLSPEALVSWVSSTNSAQRSIPHLVKVVQAFLDTTEDGTPATYAAEHTWSPHIIKMVTALQDNLPPRIHTQCLSCLAKFAAVNSALAKLVVTQATKIIRAMQPDQLPTPLLKLVRSLRTLPSVQSEHLLEVVLEHGLGWAVRRLADSVGEHEITDCFNELESLMAQSTLVKVSQVETLLSVVVQSNLGNMAGLQLATASLRVVHLKPALVNRQLQAIIQHPRFFKLCSREPGQASIRENIVGLLYKLFNLHPTNTCQPSHIGPLLRIYHGTLSTADTQLFSILNIFEQEKKLSTVSMLAGWNSNTTVVSGTTLEALQSLDPVLVLRTSLNFPCHRRFDKILQQYPSSHAPLYDPLFILLLFACMLTTNPPTTALAWVELFRTNTVGLLIRALSSNNGQVRELSLSQLGALWKHLRPNDMQEQPQVHHILNLLRDSYESPVATNFPKRLPSYSSLILLHALRAVFYPSNFIYPLTSRFLLQRPELDTKDVPMLYGMLYSNSDDWRKERGWILRFLADGMMNTDDWRVLKKRHTWDLLASLFQSAEADQNLRNSIFEVLANLTCNQQAATSLVLKTSLLTWIEMQLLTISPTMRQKEGMQWMKVLENILTVVDPARIERSLGSSEWRETICRCICLVLEDNRTVHATELMLLAASVIMRCGLLTPTPPQGLSAAVDRAVACLNQLEELIDLQNQTSRQEHYAFHLPPYRSYAIHEPPKLSNSVEGWGHVVTILWQASMLLDSPDQWDKLTSRMLIVEEMGGEGERRTAEWVRKEVVKNLAFQL